MCTVHAPKTVLTTQKHQSTDSRLRTSLQIPLPLAVSRSQKSAALHHGLLAILVYRSRFLPRFLGVWLIINGSAYVILNFTGLLLPQYYNALFNSAFPALLGEVAFMLWLLIKGAKPQPLAAPAS